MWTLAISRWCISSAFQAAEEVRVLMEVPFFQGQDVAPVPNVTTHSGSIVNMTRTSPVRTGGIGVAARIFLGHAVHVVHRAFRGTMDHADAYFHPKVGA